MGVIGDVRAELAGKLAAAGLPVTLDPRVTPPAVLVDVVSPIATAARTWSITYQVKVVGVPPGDAGTLGWLEETVEAVLVLLPIGAEARAGTVTVADHELPGYVVEAPGTVPNPTC